MEQKEDDLQKQLIIEIQDLIRSPRGELIYSLSINHRNFGIILQKFGEKVDGSSRILPRINLVAIQYDPLEIDQEQTDKVPIVMSTVNGRFLSQQREFKPLHGVEISLDGKKPQHAQVIAAINDIIMKAQADAIAYMIIRIGTGIINRAGSVLDKFTPNYFLTTTLASLHRRKLLELSDLSPAQLDSAIHI